MVLSFGLLKSSFRPPAPQQASSFNSALQEALRLHPFTVRAAESSNFGLRGDREATEREGLNNDLITLSGLFPDIQWEVFRELLVKFDGDSRLHVCVGQLLRNRTQWVKGRWQAPPRNVDNDIPLHSLFRSIEYKLAVQQFLSHEFRYLSRSTVEGVLAESNHSYTRARPTLSDLSNRTWRATISNLNIFKKKRESHTPPTQLLGKFRRADGVLDVGSAELSDELQELFLQPARRAERQRQQEQDYRLAQEINEAQARKEGALYDCECCCGEATFENMSSCSMGAHMVCFDCIRRTIHEALFGQGWGRSLDPDHGSLKCLAPVVNDSCIGRISPLAVQQALRAQKAGEETWAKFEDRLVEDSLLKSQLKLVRCPFCFYAEADPSQRSTDARPLTWKVKPTSSITAFLASLLLIDFLPAILFFVILLSALRHVDPIVIFQRSLHNLSLRHRSPRFKCRNPSCSRASCLRCQKAWHDPHTCHEPLLLSLRTTVEAARTAAIKRTCPRCGLSFVKASGCNKLTCVCGYSMCYLCRTALGAPSFIDYPRAGRGAEDMEGYRHFCEHFRVNPGRPCTECRKCELYRSEDEDAVIKSAGEAAEREWRVREGMVGVEGLGEMPGHEGKGWIKMAMSREWTLQDLADWIAERLLQVEF